MRNKDIYKKVCDEIIMIMSLFPDWKFLEFIKDEELDISKGFVLYNALKEYREKLELDNHVVCEDEELKKIMAEGLKIHNLIIKEQMYGSSEED
tara:strand:- start:38 stop:319 length:282 start_codon:yes stop_codon:yes gene_type:complete